MPQGLIGDKMSKIIDLVKKYKEIILYLIVGAMTTAISFLVQWLFTDIVVLPYVFLATVIAWLVSVLFAFFANKIVVFERKEKKGFFVELALFYASRSFTGLLEVGIIFVFVDLIGFNDWVIKIIASVIIIILNYVLSKFVVFKRKKGEKAE